MLVLADSKTVGNRTHLRLKQTLVQEGVAECARCCTQCSTECSTKILDVNFRSLQATAMKRAKDGSGGLADPCRSIVLTAHGSAGATDEDLESVGTPARLEPFVDADEAAEFLRLHRRRVLQLARRGKLPAYPIGGGPRKVWRFRLSELAAAMLDSRQRSHVPEEI